MSFGETVALGAIAGLTIFIGLPIGRMRVLSERMRLSLAMFSVGILAFIFMDVTKHGQAIVETALNRYKHHTGSLGEVLGLFALLAVGFTIGTAGISAVERRLRARRSAPAPLAGGEADVMLDATPAAHAQTDAGDTATTAAATAERRALQTGMTIAVAIGLHNFAEGLAIGVSARTGAIGLATVLVIGFGLHNATEGFGIVGPLGKVRPSWRWLALAGLIGGGPTFLGTIVGYQVDSEALELLFYALAGGAILYVIGEIWMGMRRYGHHTLGLYLIAAGFLVGVATDLVVAYGGG
ncbi:MAG TPA: ZIP family metal transporter [Solirubrobacteraceae bacterium]|jgi:ZIP family zinc transporter|nr:ZIP family metal transporter [Solirubrobacteraceae bacterium]